jgi:hypothetical protein
MPKPLLQSVIALSLLVLWPLAGLGFPAEMERSSDLLTVTDLSPVVSTSAKAGFPFKLTQRRTINEAIQVHRRADHRCHQAA